MKDTVENVTLCLEKGQVNVWTKEETLAVTAAENSS